MIAKHLFITLFFTCISLTMQVAVAKESSITKMDRIIAVVDQAVITEQELADRMKSVQAQLEKQGTALPAPEILEKQVLERLIVDSLQLQFAARTGLKVDDAQLDKTIDRIAAQNKLTL